MNQYILLCKVLEKLRCERCKGSGEIDDADLGDIYFNKWVCPDCNGAGVNLTNALERKEPKKGS